MSGLDDVINRDSTAQKVNREIQFSFTEGPANDGEGNLYFVDNTTRLIYKHDMTAKTFCVWAFNTQLANGSIFYKNGPLVSCRAEGRDIVVWRDDGTVDRVIVAEYNGQRLNEPNDLVISKTGWIYFTDPLFQPSDEKVLNMGVYALSPEGVLELICDDIKGPNGIILTPDENTLIIDGTFQPELIAYDVTSNGSVINRRVYGMVQQPDEVLRKNRSEDWYGCDGMAIDEEGHLIVTTGIGLQVFNDQGEYLGVIDVPEKPCNAAFGGPDNTTLYITAQTSLYTIDWQVPGINFQQ